MMNAKFRLANLISKIFWVNNFSKNIKIIHWKPTLIWMEIRCTHKNIQLLVPYTFLRLHVLLREVRRITLLVSGMQKIILSQLSRIMAQGNELQGV
jgi:hypothetical protein